MQKKILVACGTGIATSTVVVKKLEEKLEEAGIDCRIIQCKVSEVPGLQKGCDLVVSTAEVSDVDEGVPVMRTMSFLTGIGIEADIDKIVEILSD